jgi:hypothetical protein
MKKIKALLLLTLLGFFLAIAAGSFAADRDSSKRAVPVPQQALTAPGSPAAGGTPGGSSPGSFTGGCCQKPGPAGLHCCDTRDCGWFDCGDMVSMPKKTYR